MRGEAKRADYILYLKENIPIAVIEAKDNNHALGSGAKQALLYGGALINYKRGVPYLAKLIKKG